MSRGAGGLGSGSPGCAAPSPEPALPAPGRTRGPRSAELGRTFGAGARWASPGGSCWALGTLRRFTVRGRAPSPFERQTPWGHCRALGRRVSRAPSLAAGPFRARTQLPARPRPLFLLRVCRSLPATPSRLGWGCGDCSERCLLSHVHRARSLGSFACPFPQPVLNRSWTGPEKHRSGAGGVGWALSREP